MTHQYIIAQMSHNVKLVQNMQQSGVCLKKTKKNKTFQGIDTIW